MNNQFVSRGGLKLQAALHQFRINPTGLTILDVGSSTGGFVDCLLENGAQKVYALDTAYGELAWKLRNDPRVVVMERTNILHLQSLSTVIPGKAEIHQSHPELISGSDIWIPHQVRDDNIKVDLISIDAGWTKLEVVLPVVKKFLKPTGIIIALLKPHYEANKKDLVKGVLPTKLAEQIKDEVVNKINDLGFVVKAQISSPILGGAGNQEFLLLLRAT